MVGSHILSGKIIMVYDMLVLGEQVFMATGLARYSRRFFESVFSRIRNTWIRLIGVAYFVSAHWNARV